MIATTLRITGLALLLAMLVAPEASYADVPTVTHMAACNQEALEAVQSGSASPTMKDEAGAEAARKGNQGPRTASTAAMTRSADPQLDGMGVAGAQDAKYRAAYRVCMRKSGF